MDDSVAEAADYALRAWLKLICPLRADATLDEAEEDAADGAENIRFALEQHLTKRTYRHLAESFRK